MHSVLAKNSTNKQGKSKLLILPMASGSLTWNHFPHCWHFVMEIHVGVTGALVFLLLLLLASTSWWTNSGVVGGLRRNVRSCDVSVNGDLGECCPQMACESHLEYGRDGNRSWMEGDLSAGSAGVILRLRPASERRRYFVTTSLIGWAQISDQPWICMRFGSNNMSQFAWWL